MNIKHLILAGFIVLVSPLTNLAQTGKIKNVELIMSGSDPNIEDAKYNIDFNGTNERIRKQSTRDKRGRT